MPQNAGIFGRFGVKTPPVPCRIDRASRSHTLTRPFVGSKPLASAFERVRATAPNAKYG